jgi:hypothetical protein
VTHNHTYGFLSFFIVVSTIVSAFTINNFQLLQAKTRNIQRFEIGLEKQKDMSFLMEFVDRPEPFTESEFVLAVLKHIGKLDQDKDIQPWLEVGAVPLVKGE